MSEPGKNGAFRGDGSLQVTVVDPTLSITQAAHRLSLSSQVRTAFADSLQELPLVLEANGLPDLLLVNVAGEITPYEVALRIQRCGYRGRILALVEDLSDPSLKHLADLRHAQCVLRPPSPDLLDETLREAVRRSVAHPEARWPSGQTMNPGPESFYGIVGRSPKLRALFSRIEKVAGVDANVCISGESGTGKELIARAIHQASSRRDRPLITLDCTTIPEGLMESHLLGHVKGAFTGAMEQREGVFSLAHTGTLFIDELCELGLPLQGKLLRVIQNREFTRVGGTKPIRTDVRLITATNKDPKREVERGTFREDLYYRIAVLMLNVPPLRERREDIPLLVEHFLAKSAALYKKPLAGVEPQALKRLVAAPWPGNVRQLENLLAQAAVLTEGDVLTERDLFAHHGSSTRRTAQAATYELGLSLREVERRHILRTLQKVRGNRSAAARLLEISLRGLQYKLKHYLAESIPSREEAQL
jgi:DNA-binding NtrC family response regulator